MLLSAQDWLWDFWLADDGATYHLFFLRAPRSLGDPDLRHWNVAIGHAVSSDLVRWERVEDALGPGAPGDFDDLATWTGSVVRAPDGAWLMFYTGSSSHERGLKQRIGVATSVDLYAWHKLAVSPVLESDARWYEQLAGGHWFDEAWRDPWVFADPAGDGWHMLLTARAGTGAPDGRGVIGHARSADLMTWRTQPPLSQPDSGFGHLEVPQVCVVDGRAVLLFSCLTGELSADRRQRGVRGGVWSAPAEDLLGPYDVASAVPVVDERFYSGRLVQDRAGRWVLLAFRNVEDGRFVGEITDPMPVAWSTTDRGLPALRVTGGTEPAPPGTGSVPVGGVGAGGVRESP